MASPRAAVAAALATLVVAAPAEARTVNRSPLLWATVNVCDTEARPDTLGLRASMPGSGRRGESMWMRFQAQYRSRAHGRWHNIAEGADSGFVRVGHAMYRARQAGVLFRFEPRAGERLVLRGAVTFEWRRGDRTVRRARVATSAGRRPAWADPRRYSRARCVIA